MKIWIFAICHNEAAILPWWLRHYGQFADRILVWDDQSTDGSREILRAHPSVTLFDCPWRGLDEDKALHHAYDVYPSARGKADLCMWVDCDEFIYSHCDMRSFLSHFHRNTTYDVIRTAGFNMVGDGLPANGYFHQQIWELNPMGVSAPVYSKPVVFRPEAKVRWVRGKHALEDCAPLVSEKPLLKLLHYRYLGAAYTAAKNAKNYERAVDKGVAWSCAAGYDGEHGAAWAEKIKGEAFNVIEAAI